MIVEWEEMDLPLNYGGNTFAFKNSPMARLLEKYTGEASGNESSTETSVTLFITMINLDAENIEKVEHLDRGTTKYKVLDSSMLA